MYVSGFLYWISAEIQKLIFNFVVKIKELELKKNKIFDLYEEGIFEKEDISGRMKSPSIQIKCKLEGKITFNKVS